MIEFNPTRYEDTVIEMFKKAMLTKTQQEKEQKMYHVIQLIDGYIERCEEAHLCDIKEASPQMIKQINRLTNYVVKIYKQYMLTYEGEEDRKKMEETGYLLVAIMDVLFNLQKIALRSLFPLDEELLAEDTDDVE